MLDVFGDDLSYESVPMPLTNQQGHGESTPSPNYIAPPDLLRYCSSNCAIDGLFAYCGLSG